VDAGDAEIGSEADVHLAAQDARQDGVPAQARVGGAGEGVDLPAERGVRRRLEELVLLEGPRRLLPQLLLVEVGQQTSEPGKMPMTSRTSTMVKARRFISWPPPRAAPSGGDSRSKPCRR